jgi:hypothetical protein
MNVMRKEEEKREELKRKGERKIEGIGRERRRIRRKRRMRCGRI